MKLKINKLLPYSEESRKYKTPTVNINNKTYNLSPNPLDKNNSVGIVIPLQFICTMPDQNSDYQYLKCNIRVENNDYKEVVSKTEYYFKDIRRGDGKRDFLFEFVPPYRGSYAIQFQMLYKQKYFIQTTQPPPEIRQASVIQLNAEDPYEVEQNIIYQQKTGSVSFPLFVQYIITNKHRDLFLQLQMDFSSEHFSYRFLNNQKSIKIGGGQTYYAMVQIYQKPEVNLFDILFSENGLMIGSFLIFQGKNRNEKKLFLKQGYKHLLFRAETIDKKVVKKDIVEVKIKFINIYGNDYKIGAIRVSINENQLPPGVKLLKISRDMIDLVKNKQETITLTMICLRSGFFQFKGIVLGIKDKNNPKEERILKYINDLTLIVQNQKETKANPIMDRTSSVIIDNLI